MDIKRMDSIRPFEPLAASLTELYTAAFEEIDSLCVQRHLMTPAELADVLINPRIQKWIAFEGTTPVGLAVITNDLYEWPLISWRYFQRHYPEYYAARKIWYVGFICAAAGQEQAYLFADLIRAMAPQVVDDHAMVAMDFSAYNIAVRHIDRATAALMKRLDRRAAGGWVDSQGFFAWTFPSARE